MYAKQNHNRTKIKYKTLIIFTKTKIFGVVLDAVAKESVNQHLLQNAVRSQN